MFKGCRSLFPWFDNQLVFTPFKSSFSQKNPFGALIEVFVKYLLEQSFGYVFGHWRKLFYGEQTVTKLHFDS